VGRMWRTSIYLCILLVEVGSSGKMVEKNNVCVKEGSFRLHTSSPTVLYTSSLYY